jgi:hypothetical protein
MFIEIGEGNNFTTSSFTVHTVHIFFPINLLKNPRNLKGRSLGFKTENPILA